MKRRGPDKPVVRTSMQFPLDGLATVQQASEFLQICKATVYAMMKDGELPQVKIRNASRVPWAALHKMANPNTETE